MATLFWLLAGVDRRDLQRLLKMTKRSTDRASELSSEQDIGTRDPIDGFHRTAPVTKVETKGV